MEENLQLECLETNIECKLLIQHTKELAVFMKKQYEIYKMDLDSSNEVDEPGALFKQSKYFSGIGCSIPLPGKRALQFLSLHFGSFGSAITRERLYRQLHIMAVCYRWVSVLKGCAFGCAPTPQIKPALHAPTQAPPCLSFQTGFLTLVL